MTKEEYNAIAIGMRRGFRFESNFVSLAIGRGFTAKEAKEAISLYEEEEENAGWGSEYEADAERRDREG